MNEAVDEVLVEITCVGDWRRVAVLDPRTGDEVVVHAPVHTSDRALIRLALRRLRRRSAPAARSTEPGLLA